MNSRGISVGVVPFDRDEDNPASRMRGFEVARALRRLGVNADVIEPEQVGECAVLVLGRYARHSYGHWRQLLREARRSGTRVILDLADNVFAWRKLSCRAIQHFPCWRRLPRCAKLWLEERTMLSVIREADHVTASSRQLMELASRHTPRCSVIPDIVGDNHFDFRKEHHDGEPVRILWTGYRDNLPHAEVLFQVLEKLSVSRAFELCVVTAEERTSPFRGTRSNREIVAALPFPTCFIPWERSRATQDLFSADIGVAPLQPGAIKSANKIVVFMAMGIPVVASPSYEYEQLIEQGKTGFICHTPAEWAEALAALIESPTLRAEMGAAGRKAVCVVHRSTAIAQQWGAVISAVLRSGT